MCNRCCLLFTDRTKCGKDNLPLGLQLHFLFMCRSFFNDFQCACWCCIYLLSSPCMGDFSLARYLSDSLPSDLLLAIELCGCHDDIDEYSRRACRSNGTCGDIAWGTCYCFAVDWRIARACRRVFIPDAAAEKYSWKQIKGTCLSMKWRQVPLSP